MIDFEGVYVFNGGLEAALIGISYNSTGLPCAVYDEAKILDILMESYDKSKMSYDEIYDEVYEYYQYNIVRTIPYMKSDSSGEPVIVKLMENNNG